MSCSFNAEFANVYVSINNLEGNFNTITANTLNNYNQISRSLSQQASVYNSIYYGSGDINTLNANVIYDLNVNGRYDMNNGNLIINNGNLIISNGGLVLSNTFGSSGQVIVSNGDSSAPFWGSSLIRGTSVTLSGTSASFTNIPSWVNQVTITINGMSTNGTTIPNILLGTSAGYVTSGYSGCLGAVPNRTTNDFSTSILLSHDNWTSALVQYSVITLYHMGSNIWVFRINTGYSNGAIAAAGNGTVTLLGLLDRIQLTINGIQVFDAGSMNIRYQ